MRLRALIALSCLAAAVVAGCGGRSDPQTPVACLEGPGVYLEALAAAPAEVRLQGETAISECLVESQTAGDLAGVGEALVGAATELNGEARQDPGGEASGELGYLIGAVQKGADQTEGIHTDLVRRLVVAARFAPGDQPLPPAFVRAYRDGFDAGRADG